MHIRSVPSRCSICGNSCIAVTSPCLTREMIHPYTDNPSSGSTLKGRDANMTGRTEGSGMKFGRVVIMRATADKALSTSAPATLCIPEKNKVYGCQL